MSFEENIIKQITASINEGNWSANAEGDWEKIFLLEDLIELLKVEISTLKQKIRNDITNINQ